MVPEDIERFTTDGEKTFYRFLQSCAKPDSQFITWYLPNIQDHEADFILYSNEIGLVIFEVKDWLLDQIIEADAHNFRFRINGKEEIRQNPFQQVKKYFNSIMDKIKDDGYLVSKEPFAHGNAKIPVSCGIVFTNINKYDYEQRGLDNIIETSKIFFWDDLHPQSPICSDPTGKCFHEFITRMFTPKFEFKITGKEFDHLKQLIFPIIRIELPDRHSPQKTYIDEIQRLKLLDHHQESIARHYDGGHRLIYGPSGSGKTLILVHRAALLMQYNPEIKRVLFLCYNVTLVNYVRRLLSDKHVTLGENGIDVLHFFQLCSRITGEQIPYEKEDSEFYDLVISEALEKVKSFPLKYDAILVDEGQDFSDDMLKIVVSLLNLKTNHLAIALDDNQNIYRRAQTWKELGIQARGRVHKLSWVYRNTREISRFAECVVNTASGLTPDDHAKGQGLLFPEIFEESHGPDPLIKLFPEYEEITAWMSDRIVKLNTEEGLPLSEIAIIYALKSSDHENGLNLPLLIEKVLDQKGLPRYWVSEDYRAKKSYDITTNSVSVSTIHSLKGFDYACVFVLGLDWMEPGRWTLDQIDRLAYVAITRARQQLFIPYCSETALIKRLIDCSRKPYN